MHRADLQAEHSCVSSLLALVLGGTPFHPVATAVQPRSRLPAESCDPQFGCKEFTEIQASCMETEVSGIKRAFSTRNEHICACSNNVLGKYAVGIRCGTWLGWGKPSAGGEVIPCCVLCKNNSDLFLEDHYKPLRLRRVFFSVNVWLL